MSYQQPAQDRAACDSIDATRATRDEKCVIPGTRRFGPPWPPFATTPVTAVATVEDTKTTGQWADPGIGKGDVAAATAPVAAVIGDARRPAFRG